MKRRFTKLTGIILAGTLAAGALDVSAVFADEDVLCSEEESFVSEYETFVPEDENAMPEEVITEEGADQPDTEANDDETGAVRSLGGVADEDDAVEVFVEGIEDDENFSDVSVSDEDNGPDQSADLPSKYNVYELGKLPKIRNQGRYGCCWAFAAVGSAEADLIHDGKATTDIDLSELQLAYYTSHNFKASNYGMDKDKYYFVPSKAKNFYLNNGGNGSLASGTLMNGIGFVSEEKLPYSAAGYTSNDDCLPDRYAQSVNSAMLTGSYYTSMNNRDLIKWMIMEHGGVNTLIHAPGDRSTSKGACFFSKEYNSYISTYENVDHVIMIVGWDDDFSRENFPDYMPGENGAWLVRNSWGSDGYDCNGYFWISYEDASLNNRRAHAFDADIHPYNNCYSYSKTGTVGKYYNYHSSNDKLKIVQNYHVNKGEKILAVGLEVTSMNVGCNVVVKGSNHKAGKRFVTDLPGYYTAELEHPFEVTDPDGEDIEVTVYYSGNNLLVPLECKGEDRIVNIKVETDIEGGGVEINGEYHGDLDSKVRLFTNNTVKKQQTYYDVVGTASPKTRIQKGITGHQGLSQDCGYSKMPEELKKEYTLEWSVENTDVAVIEGDNTKDEVDLKAVGAGSTYLICKCFHDGEVYTSESEITVDPYTITYDLGGLKQGQDVFSAYELPDWFFPGNKEQCSLEDVARAGYDFDGWYEDRALTQPVTQELLTANENGHFEKDLVLYPKWSKRQLTIAYQSLRSDLSGYEDKTIEIAKVTVDDFTGEGNTYALPDAATTTKASEVYGWSLDGYGYKAVNGLGIDDAFGLELAYEDQYYDSRYVQKDVVVIYPQYGKWEIDASSVKWSDDPFAGSDDLVTATLTRRSAEDEVLTVDENVPADTVLVPQHTGETWSKKGSITYKAVWERKGVSVEDTRSYEIAPIKDSYKDPEWSWVKDDNAKHGYRVKAQWTRKDAGYDESYPEVYEVEAAVSSVTRSGGMIVMNAVATMDDGTTIESAPFSAEAKNRSASTDTEKKEITAGEFTAVQEDTLDLYDCTNMVLVYFKGQTMNAEPYSITLTKGSEWYSVVYDDEAITENANGYAVVGLKLREDILTESLVKQAAANNKIVFSVRGVNSTNAVECPLTLKTTYKAPKAKLDRSSATFYEDLAGGTITRTIVHETTDLIYQDGYYDWKADYCIRKGRNYEVVEGSSVGVDISDQSFLVSVPKGSYKDGFIRIHYNGWAEDAFVYAKFAIRFTKSSPAIELTQKKISLNLNNAGDDEKAVVAVKAKGGGTLHESVLTTLSVEGEDRLISGLSVDKSSLTKDGTLTVKLGDAAGKKGNCKLFVTGTLPDGKKKKLTLTINVSDTASDKAVKFDQKGSIDALGAGQVFVKPGISGYTGSIVSAEVEPVNGKNMYEASMGSDMIVIRPGKDFVYEKKGTTVTLKVTLDTKAVLKGTIKIKPSVGKLSAGSVNSTVKIDKESGTGSATVPVMAVYSYKYYTAPGSYETRIRVFDIDAFDAFGIEAKKMKELNVEATPDKGLLTITTTPAARAGKTYTVPVTVRETATGAKASLKMKVSLTE